MIDLTPLDVRKKKGDFRRGLRGYDAPHVDDFLDIVADRLETLVRENLALREQVARFENQTADHREREKALTEALVTAQEMREEVRAQSAREADAARREAENDAVRIRAEAQQIRAREEEALRRLRGRQLEFLRTYRAFLERELAELASTVRGLEMNGAMGDAFLAAPRMPDAATESGFAGAAAVVAATPDAPTAPQPSGDEWAVLAPPPSEPSAARAPEPELILSDDDVLTDGDVVADSDSSTDDDVAPIDAMHLPPAAGEGPDGSAHEADSIGAGDTAGDDRVGADEAPPSQSPAAAETSVGGLDLDLIPELDDLAELDDPDDEDADRSLDAKPVEDAETADPEAKRSASKRRAVGDDTDNLLRSLFGDEQ